MSKIIYLSFMISLCLTAFSSCCLKSKKQPSGFYAMGLLDIHEEYITTDSSYSYEHYYISRYIFLNENDSMLLLVSDKKTDSLFFIKCKEKERRLFKEYTTLSVNDLKKNPFNNNSPCCLFPLVVYAENDTVKSPGLFSGCEANLQMWHRFIHSKNRQFISDVPSFNVLEKRYMMEGISKQLISEANTL